MHNIVNKDKIRIENLIYEINDKQVMLDTDLAKLYGTETKRINEAVSRNKEKFPDRYCFKISEKEYNTLKSQIATSKGGSRKGHTMFTEQGIAMLATVLKTEVAIKVSISIMDAFVAMRKYISNDLYHNNYILNNHENRLLKLEETFDTMCEKNKVNTIFYDGQIYDAYSLLVDILKDAKEEIIIIDNYANKELLDIIKNINKKTLVISKNIDDILVKKYKNQYSNVEFKQLDIFHDRFIILDRKKLYHCGASFKDLGKKCFAINEMESKETLNILLDKILKE